MSIDVMRVYNASFASLISGSGKEIKNGGQGKPQNRDFVAEVEKIDFLHFLLINTH